MLGQHVFDNVVLLGVGTDHALAIHFVVFMQRYFCSE
jgi:hypothetical protein